jgi:hypothetical protein
MNFSAIESEEYDEPIDFGKFDPKIEQSFQEDSFLFILKALPKDRYRVIALLLYLKNEMDYNYTYEDIASLWGHSKVNVFNTIQRMQKTLKKAGLLGRVCNLRSLQKEYHQQLFGGTAAEENRIIEP